MPVLLARKWLRLLASRLLADGNDGARLSAKWEAPCSTPAVRKRRSITANQASATHGKSQYCRTHPLYSHPRHREALRRLSSAMTHTLCFRLGKGQGTGRSPPLYHPHFTQNQGNHEVQRHALLI